MQTIRGIFLIVSSFTISIYSLTQERIDINQTLLIVDEITFGSYTLNSISQGDCSTDLKVKTIQPILMITELIVDDLLHKPYVLSVL